MGSQHPSRRHGDRRHDRLTPDQISTRVLAQEARESAELIAAQNRVLELVARGAPLQYTLNVLLQEIEAQVPNTLSSILLLDSDGIHVRHGAAPTLPESYVRAIDGESIGPRAGSCGTAAYRGEAVIVDDIATDPLWDGYRDVALTHGLRACWSTPIISGDGRVLGTFALYYRQPRSPTEADFALIARVTHVAGIAIQRPQADEQLHQLSAHAGGALRERVRAEERRRADNLVREGLADAAGVAAQQPELKLLRLLFRDRFRDETAEAGVDPVRVLARSVGRPLDQFPRRAHLRSRVVRERGGGGAVRDCPHVAETEIVPGQADRRGLRHPGSL